MVAIGEKLPEIVLNRATADGPDPVRLGDLTAGKTVVLFAVPGAFTPTCSARHLPGFVEKRDALAGAGIDAVYCTAVNDAFVMRAWAESAGATEAVDFLADGNGDLARALGLETDSSAFGMGQRSKRYALVAKDGVVTHLFVDEGGTFEKSSADYVLSQL